MAPAKPNGFRIKTVEVTSPEAGVYTIVMTPYNCGHDLPLLSLAYGKVRLIELLLVGQVRSGQVKVFNMHIQSTRLSRGTGSSVRDIRSYFHAYSHLSFSWALKLSWAHISAYLAI